MREVFMGRRSGELRTRLAQEAARILAEEGVRDHLRAKKKAMQRLGVQRAQQQRVLPTNQEIESALVEHLRLFKGDDQPERLRHLRETAVKAMRLFDAFGPRLVGGVLDGTATLHADIRLHVFAETPEELAMHLMNSDIPFDTDERRFRLTGGGYGFYPVYRFLAGDVLVDITVFSPRDRAQPPCSPVDGRPMRRGTLAELEEMLAEQA
jgi:hypothetical protein